MYFVGDKTMSITLREVTVKNFKDCIELEVAEGQKKFVATNARSIALSKVAPYLIPLAVYSEEEMVGFSLSGRDEGSKKYHIVRLMIGTKFQGNGFGKAAT